MKSLFQRVEFVSFWRSLSVSEVKFKAFGLEEVTEDDVRWLGLNTRMDNAADVPIEAFQLTDAETLDSGLGMLRSWIQDHERVKDLDPEHSFGESSFKSFCVSAKQEVEKWCSQEGAS